MERTSTRAWRRIQKKRVWRNRLRLLLKVFTPTYLETDIPGEVRVAKTWKELQNVKWCQVYRTTAQPCSCPFCKGERYNRRDFKKETKRLIEEEL